MLNNDQIAELQKAKDNITEMFKTEGVRHESSLNVLLSRYEAGLRLENDYHTMRASELEEILEEFEKRLKG